MARASHPSDLHERSRAGGATAGARSTLGLEPVSSGVAKMDVGRWTGFARRIRSASPRSGENRRGRGRTAGGARPSASLGSHRRRARRRARASRARDRRDVTTGARFAPRSCTRSGCRSRVCVRSPPSTTRGQRALAASDGWQIVRRNRSPHLAPEPSRDRLRALPGAPRGARVYRRYAEEKMRRSRGTTTSTSTIGRATSSATLAGVPGGPGRRCRRMRSGTCLRPS